MLFFIHLERFLPQQAAPRVKQKPRHTLLCRALETFQTGQSARGCAALRRLTPTKHYSLRSRTHPAAPGKSCSLRSRTHPAAPGKSCSLRSRTHPAAPGKSCSLRSRTHPAAPGKSCSLRSRTHPAAPGFGSAEPLCLSRKDPDT